MKKASSNGNDGNEMIVKRVSVPIGLEELMEGLAKEVLLKKPQDLYVFAAKYFSQLLLLRDRGDYKVKTVRSAQTVAEHNRKWTNKRIANNTTSKLLPRQVSIRDSSTTIESTPNLSIYGTRGISNSDRFEKLKNTRNKNRIKNQDARRTQVENVDKQQKVQRVTNSDSTGRQRTKIVVDKDKNQRSSSNTGRPRHKLPTKPVSTTDESSISSDEKVSNKGNGKPREKFDKYKNKFESSRDGAFLKSVPLNEDRDEVNEKTTEHDKKIGEDKSTVADNSLAQQIEPKIDVDQDKLANEILTVEAIENHKQAVPEDKTSILDTVDIGRNGAPDHSQQHSNTVEDIKNNDNKKDIEEEGHGLNNNDLIKSDHLETLNTNVDSTNNKNDIPTNDVVNKVNETTQQNIEKESDLKFYKDLLIVPVVDTIEIMKKTKEDHDETEVTTLPSFSGVPLDQPKLLIEDTTMNFYKQLLTPEHEIQRNDEKKEETVSLSTANIKNDISKENPIVHELMKPESENETHVINHSKENMLVEKISTAEDKDRPKMDNDEIESKYNEILTPEPIKSIRTVHEKSIEKCTSLVKSDIIKTIPNCYGEKLEKAEKQVEELVGLVQNNVVVNKIIEEQDELEEELDVKTDLSTEKPDRDGGDRNGQPNDSSNKLIESHPVQNNGNLIGIDGTQTMSQNLIQIEDSQKISTIVGSEQLTNDIKESSKLNDSKETKSVVNDNETKLDKITHDPSFSNSGTSKDKNGSESNVSKTDDHVGENVGIANEDEDSIHLPKSEGDVKKMEQIITEHKISNVNKNNNVSLDSKVGDIDQLLDNKKHIESIGTNIDKVIEHVGENTESAHKSQAETQSTEFSATDNKKISSDKANTITMGNSLYDVEQEVPSVDEKKVMTPETSTSAQKQLNVKHSVQVFQINVESEHDDSITDQAEVQTIEQHSSETSGKIDTKSIDNMDNVASVKNSSSNVVKQVNDKLEETIVKQIDMKDNLIFNEQQSTDRDVSEITSDSASVPFLEATDKDKIIEVNEGHPSNIVISQDISIETNLEKADSNENKKNTHELEKSKVHNDNKEDVIKSLEEDSRKHENIDKANLSDDINSKMQSKLDENSSRPDKLKKEIDDVSEKHKIAESINADTINNQSKKNESIGNTESEISQTYGKEQNKSDLINVEIFENTVKMEKAPEDNKLETKISGTDEVSKGNLLNTAVDLNQNVNSVKHNVSSKSVDTKESEEHNENIGVSRQKRNISELDMQDQSTPTTDSSVQEINRNNETEVTSNNKSIINQILLYARNNKIATDIDEIVEINTKTKLDDNIKTFIKSFIEIEQNNVLSTNQSTFIPLKDNYDDGNNRTVKNAESNLKSLDSRKIKHDPEDDHFIIHQIIKYVKNTINPEGTNELTEDIHRLSTDGKKLINSFIEKEQAAAFPHQENVSATSQEKDVISDGNTNTDKRGHDPPTNLDTKGDTEVIYKDSSSERNNNTALIRKIIDYVCTITLVGSPMSSNYQNNATNKLNDEAKAFINSFTKKEQGNVFVKDNNSKVVAKKTKGNRSKYVDKTEPLIMPRHPVNKTNSSIPTKIKDKPIPNGKSKIGDPNNNQKSSKFTNSVLKPKSSSRSSSISRKDTSGKPIRRVKSVDIIGIPENVNELKSRIPTADSRYRKGMLQKRKLNNSIDDKYVEDNQTLNHSHRSVYINGLDAKIDKNEEMEEVVNGSIEKIDDDVFLKDDHMDLTEVAVATFDTSKLHQELVNIEEPLQNTTRSVTESTFDISKLSSELHNSEKQDVKVEKRDKELLDGATDVNELPSKVADDGKSPKVDENEKYTAINKFDISKLHQEIFTIDKLPQNSISDDNQINRTDSISYELLKHKNNENVNNINSEVDKMQEISKVATDTENMTEVYTNGKIRNSEEDLVQNIISDEGIKSGEKFNTLKLHEELYNGGQLSQNIVEDTNNEISGNEKIHSISTETEAEVENKFDISKLHQELHDSDNKDLVNDESNSVNSNKIDQKELPDQQMESKTKSESITKFDISKLRKELQETIDPIEEHINYESPAEESTSDTQREVRDQPKFDISKLHQELNMGTITKPVEIPVTSVAIENNNNNITKNYSNKIEEDKKLSKADSIKIESPNESNELSTSIGRTDQSQPKFDISALHKELHRVDTNKLQIAGTPTDTVGIASEDNEVNKTPDSKKRGDFSKSVEMEDKSLSNKKLSSKCDISIDANTGTLVDNKTISGKIKHKAENGTPSSIREKEGEAQRKFDISTLHKELSTTETETNTIKDDNKPVVDCNSSSNMSNSNEQSTLEDQGVREGKQLLSTNNQIEELSKFSISKLHQELYDVDDNESINIVKHGVKIDDNKKSDSIGTISNNVSNKKKHLETKAEPSSLDDQRKDVNLSKLDHELHDFISDTKNINDKNMNDKKLSSERSSYDKTLDLEEKLKKYSKSDESSSSKIEKEDSAQQKFDISTLHEELHGLVNVKNDVKSTVVGSESNISSMLKCGERGAVEDKRVSDQIEELPIFSISKLHQEIYEDVSDNINIAAAKSVENMANEATQVIEDNRKSNSSISENSINIVKNNEPDTVKDKSIHDKKASSEIKVKSLDLEQTVNCTEAEDSNSTNDDKARPKFDISNLHHNNELISDSVIISDIKENQTIGKYEENKQLDLADSKIIGSGADKESKITVLSEKCIEDKTVDLKQLSGMDKNLNKKETSASSEEQIEDKTQLKFDISKLHEVVNDDTVTDTVNEISKAIEGSKISEHSIWDTDSSIQQDKVQVRSKSGDKSQPKFNISTLHEELHGVKKDNKGISNTVVATDIKMDDITKNNGRKEKISISDSKNGYDITQTSGTSENSTEKETLLEDHIEGKSEAKSHEVINDNMYVPDIDEILSSKKNIKDIKMDSNKSLDDQIEYESRSRFDISKLHEELHRDVNGGNNLSPTNNIIDETEANKDHQNTEFIIDNMLNNREHTKDEKDKDDNKISSNKSVKVNGLDIEHTLEKYKNSAEKEEFLPSNYKSEEKPQPKFDLSVLHEELNKVITSKQISDTDVEVDKLHDKSTENIKANDLEQTLYKYVGATETLPTTNSHKEDMSQSKFDISKLHEELNIDLHQENISPDEAVANYKPKKLGTVISEATVSKENISYDKSSPDNPEVSKVFPEFEGIQKESGTDNFKSSYDPYKLRKEINQAGIYKIDEIDKTSDEFLKIVQAIIKIQSFWRGSKVRKHLPKVQQTKTFIDKKSPSDSNSNRLMMAAVRIQKFWRVFRSRKNKHCFQSYESSSSNIGSSNERENEKSEKNILLESISNKSAILNSEYSKHKLANSANGSTRSAELEKEIKSAIKIQSIWRVFVARKIAKEIRLSRSGKEMSKHPTTNLSEDEAAIKIEAASKGYLQRKSYTEIHRTATTTQSDINDSTGEKVHSVSADRPTSIDSTDSRVTVINQDNSDVGDDSSSDTEVDKITDYQYKLLNQISGYNDDIVVRENHVDELIADNQSSNNMSEARSPSPTVTNSQLLHSSELHDSIILPVEITSYLEDDDIKNKKEKDNAKQENLGEINFANTGLLHTSEMHDLVVIPTFNVENHNATIESVQLTDNGLQSAETVLRDKALGISTSEEGSNNKNVLNEDGQAQASPTSDATTHVTIEAHAPPKAALGDAAQPELSQTWNFQSMASEKRAQSNSSTDKNMEAEAATKIQAGFRGYKVRKQLKMKNGPTEGEKQRRPSRTKTYVAAIPRDVEEQSAVKIQAGIRGFLVRRRQKRNSENNK